MQCRLCLQVSAVAGHHQEEDRGPHRAGVHQEGGQRQESLHLPRLREGASCQERKTLRSCDNISRKIDLVQGLLFREILNDLVEGVSEAGGVVFIRRIFLQFSFQLQ